MSTELLSAEVDLDLQKEEENDDQVLKNVEQEICPRCYDIMTLSSDLSCLSSLVIGRIRDVLVFLLI
jgi:hypothetical protein